MIYNGKSFLHILREYYKKLFIVLVNGCHNDDTFIAKALIICRDLNAGHSYYRDFDIAKALLIDYRHMFYFKVQIKPQYIYQNTTEEYITSRMQIYLPLLILRPRDGSTIEYTCSHISFFTSRRKKNSIARILPANESGVK